MVEDIGKRGGKLAIMQPYLFPYIGYFQLLNAADRFVIYDDVNFMKQGWINRNNILISGRPHLFTLPIKSISSFTPINLVQVDDRLYGHWRTKFLRSLAQSYVRASNFAETHALVESVLAMDATHVGEIARSSITAVADYIGVDTIVIPSSTQYDNAHLRAQDRVLDICRKEGTEHYINAQGGRSLYDRETFSRNGLKLSFIQSKLSAYGQLTKEFVPGLSIIDVLMFNKPETIKSMLTEFELC